MEIISQLTRQFIDSQVPHFFSPFPVARKSTKRFFRAVVSMKSAEIDTMLQHTDVGAHLEGKLGGYPEEEEGQDQSGGHSLDAEHPLALHRLQLGELTVLSA